MQSCLVTWITKKRQKKAQLGLCPDSPPFSRVQKHAVVDLTMGGNCLKRLHSMHFKSMMGSVHTHAFWEKGGESEPWILVSTVNLNLIQWSTLGCACPPLHLPVRSGCSASPPPCPTTTIIPAVITRGRSRSDLLTCRLCLYLNLLVRMVSPIFSVLKRLRSLYEHRPSTTNSCSPLILVSIKNGIII